MKHTHTMKQVSCFPKNLLSKHSSTGILLFIFLILSGYAKATDECMMLPIPVQDRVQSASLITEAEVMSTSSFWNKQHNMIFTVSHLKIYKVFKGNKNLREFDIITTGGTVGLDRIEMTSNLILHPGQQGIFFCNVSGLDTRISYPGVTTLYDAYGLQQGFVEYNLSENSASTPFFQFSSITGQLYNEVMSYTGIQFQQVETNVKLNQSIQQLAVPKTGGNTTQAVPTITNFTPTSITAGTHSILTINGTNFGATRGTGFVEFKNANDGGATYVKAKVNDYLTWTNTQITLYVPSSSLSGGPSAGTGTIRVTNSDPNFVVSASQLTITYSHINVEFNSTGFYTEHINDNTTGGYTFQFNSTRFATNAPAVAAFTRAMNTWTCNTNINWIIGANTAVDTVLADGINIVRFDIGPSMPTNVLGTATSRLSGCVGGVDTVWTVTEIDVIYDDGAAGLAWQYGPTLANINQIDFESVTVHELGHAHQLQHIILSGAVMHYAISNGQNTRTLSAANDIAGGNYVLTKSFATHGACKTSGSQMTALSLAASVSIAANPGNNVCATSSVTFTATPVLPAGTPVYQWKKNGVNVGTNSTSYTNASWVNGDIVTCVMTVSGGCNEVKTSNAITMTVNAASAVSVSIAASPSSTICSGTNVTFTATPTNGGTPAYQWKKNGVNVGTNSATYSDATLANGNTISCVMTSSLGCTTGNPATSNTITMTVNANVAASVSIAASPSVNICSGTNVTFTATPTNGGPTPVYQWKKNGVNVGTNSVTYSDAGLANGNTITCTMTSNANCVTGSPATSNTLTMTVTASVAASVSIAASPAGTICSGTNVTFTATPTNGGSTPVYQWKKNGVNVGTNSVTYSDATLANGNTITCTMTSNATCVTGNPATSNTITMTVTTPAAASVSIAASPSSTICSGTSVTFTATPVNGGVLPSYQWKKNGVNVGLNLTTYTDGALANGDAIQCVLTSNLSCVSGSPATSNTISMTVNPNLPASISIAASPSTTICSGTNVTFTATPTNGGSTPVYQWKKNGVNVGLNSNTYSDAALANGNTITCTMTSNATCVTGSPANSNTLTMTVNANVPASVNIAVSPSNTVCAGTLVTFAATPTNGGTTPVYQWKKNNLNVGTNNSAYSDASLVNSDIITCVMTSNATCVTGSPATSNSVTMTVNPNLPTSVSVSASPSTTICSGAVVNFTATPTNGGTTPVYQWRKNSSNVGTNSPTYSDGSLSNNDTVYCILTSNATCATGSPATSNKLIMTVNTIFPVSVSIAASPSTSICSGTNVTFTATPVNGGALPTYQWKKNGVNVGTNSPSYSDAGLANGNSIQCVLTSSHTCSSGNPATSNTITMTVTNNVAASVSISVSPAANICQGTNVTFTATPTNGGASPVYQWKKNGVNVGTNSTTYSDATLANSNTINCVMTSNASCVTGNPATSNTVTMTVLPNVTASVSIAASPSVSICYGTNVTFTATPTNGGQPVYQWKRNGANVGSNSSTYSNATLTNGNTISCVMTSNATCVSGNPAASNTLTMSVDSIPKITSFTPGNGSVGNSVVITGSYFSSATQVQFNTTNATFVVNNANQITATVPAGATSGTIKVINPCGTGTSLTSFTINPSSVTLTLTVFIEGYYLNGAPMPAVINPGIHPNVCDTVTVELVSPGNTTVVQASDKKTIGTNGVGTFTFPGSMIGSFHWIVVKHRNSIQTWSAAAVNFPGSTVSYNFTNAQNQAFGSNQIANGDGTFSIRSGDVNQDDLIESTDFGSIENASQSFLSGYVSEDLTGDNLVESSDYGLGENNSQLFLFAIKP
ncbi:MAG: IPT/TIG domain-containing protein [Bacteroidia bacterium]